MRISVYRTGLCCPSVQAALAHDCGNRRRDRTGRYKRKWTYLAGCSAFPLPFANPALRVELVVFAHLAFSMRAPGSVASLVSTWCQTVPGALLGYCVTVGGAEDANPSLFLSYSHPILVPAPASSAMTGRTTALPQAFQDVRTNKKSRPKAAKVRTTE